MPHEYVVIMPIETASLQNLGWWDGLCFVSVAEIVYCQMRQMSNIN
jgi:hypothetical protein